MSRHRRDVRPRYGRIAVLGASLLVTLVAVLGGVGLLPRQASPEAAGAPSVLRLEDQQVPGARAATTDDRTADSSGTGPGSGTDSGPGSAPAPSPAPTRRTGDSARGDGGRERVAVTTPPADSGSGRRVVFSEEQQRVWLVTAEETVQRTYLASGSVEDNLDPGTYEVYSRSERAWGIDDSGTMRWFVRFTQGDNAAIGFHDIPVDEGEPVQSVADLGTPLSHGCIRQKEADARALWEFAPLGTTVVVL